MFLLRSIQLGEKENLCLFSELGEVKLLNQKTIHFVPLLFGTSLIILIAGMGWFFLASLDEFFQKDKINKSQDELREMLPMLRERMSQKSIAFEGLISSIKDVSTISTQTPASIVNRLSTCFGKTTRFAIWDSSGKILENSRFSISTLSRLELILDDLFGRNEKHFEAKRAALELFGDDDLYLMVDENYVGISEVVFRGKEKGVILMGALVSEKKDRLKDDKTPSFLFRSNPARKGAIEGTIAVFVPFGAISGSSEVERIHRVLRDNVSMPFWTGEIESLVEANDLPQSLKLAIREELRTGRIQGVRVSERWGACFFASPFNSKRAIVYWKKIDEVWRMARSPLIVIFGGTIVAFILSGFWLQFGFLGDWNSSIIKKFMVLCISCCAVPSIGLLGVVFARNYWENNKAVIDTFNKMEGKIRNLENQHERLLGEIVSKIKRFTLPARWRKKLPTRNEISASVEQLYSLGVGEAYIIHNTLGKLWVPSSLRESNSAKKTREVVTGLIIAFQENLRFGNSKVQEQVKGQIILDIIKGLFGNSSIYRLVLKQDVLSTFTLFMEGTWTYLNILTGLDKKPLLLFFFTIDRDGIQRKEVMKWAETKFNEQSGVPDLILMKNEFHSLLSFYPEWAARFPMIHSMLVPMAREGGIQKFGFSIAGKPMLFLARPLKGMDYVGLAIQPNPSVKELTIFRENERFFAFAIFYPFLVATLGIHLFNTFFLKPILSLKTGVETISRGNYDVQLPVLSNDEIGNLCHSFNQMACGLKEKEYLERFLSDLTKEVVRDSEKAQATRTHASVMFSDIRKFTTLSETYPPEEIVELLNEYLTKMEEVIESHGGTVEKFIGDAIMAVFLPTHGMKAPAIRAAETGLAMMKTLNEFNRFRSTSGKFAINIGVGIATGEVIMGILGRKDGRQDFTIVGPTVKLAAHMEKLTKQAQSSFVVVCSNSRPFLGNDYYLSPIVSTEDTGIVA
ncbi:HAMP domain-containing protein, partial [bacterium]|nr:HAMP domain-containing protein [bacterium]